MAHEQAALLRNDPQRETIAGSILIGCGLLSVLVLSHHPLVKARTAHDLFTNIAQISLADRVVHGAVIVLVVLLLFALSAFSLRVGIRRPPVLLALIAYALGAVCLVGAALIDGFFVSQIGEQYAGSPHASAQTGVAFLQFCAIAIQIFTHLAVAAAAVAMLLWSASFARLGRGPLCAAIVGLAAAVVQAYMLVTAPSISAHGIMVIIGAQAAWYLAVGILLIRGDL